MSGTDYDTADAEEPVRQVVAQRDARRATPRRAQGRDLAGEQRAQDTMARLQALPKGRTAEQERRRIQKLTDEKKAQQQKAERELEEEGRTHTGIANDRKRKRPAQKRGQAKKRKEAGILHCGRYNYRGCQQGLQCSHMHAEFNLEAREKYIAYLKKTGKYEASLNWDIKGEYPQEILSPEYQQPQIEQAIVADQPFEPEEQEEELTIEDQKEQAKQELLGVFETRKQKYLDSAKQDPTLYAQAQTVFEGYKKTMDIELQDRLKEIDEQAEIAKRNCFQMFQRDFATREQKSTPQWQHKFAVVPTGELGNFKFHVTKTNKDGILRLTQDLINRQYEMYCESLDPLAFTCGYCKRTLDVPLRMRHTFNATVACRVCFGVLYCCREHREVHRAMHQFCCSMHPAWRAPTNAEIKSIDGKVEENDAEIGDMPEKLQLEVNEDGRNLRGPPQARDEYHSSEQREKRKQDKAKAAAEQGGDDEEVVGADDAAMEQDE